MCNTMPAGEQATLTASTIEIGISAVISGPDAIWEANTNAATLLAIDEINASSDILPGVTLIPTFADDAGEYGYGFMAAWCLGQRGVPVVIGPTYSGAGLGAATIARTLELPLVGPSTTSPQLNDRDPTNGYPTFNRIITSDEFQGAALVRLAIEFGWKKVSTLSVSQDTYTQDLAKAFAKTAETSDVDIALSQSIGENHVGDDVKLVLEAIKNSGSRVIYAFLYQSQVEVVIPLAKELGMIGPEWVWI